MVIVPLFADQIPNGKRVAAAGAGVVLERGSGPHSGMGTVTRADTGRIEGAIATVLAGDSFRRCASRIAAEMRATATIESLLAGFENSR